MLECRLDDLGEGEGAPLPCRIEYGDGAIWIHVDGYGTFNDMPGDGFPIKVELYNGELQILLWRDIRSGDPSDVLGMQLAQETGER